MTKKSYRLYCADCLEKLLELPENTFDMIFADPPYMLSNGGITCQNGCVVSVNKGDWDKSHGLSDDFEFHKKWLCACHRVLKPNGKIILHLGKTDKYNMVNELSKYATQQFEIVCAGDEDVTSIEKHGVDKGRTVGHQFLFLEKN